MTTKVVAKSMLKQFFVFALFFIINACAINTPQTDSSVSPTTEAKQVAVSAQTSEPEPFTAAEVSTVAEQNVAIEDGRPLAARVNGQPIFLETYEKQVAQFRQSLAAQGVDLDSEDGQAQLRQIEKQVLGALIDQVIIEQEANRLGITISEELLEAKAQESAAQGPDQAQFQAWLSANNLTYEDFKETLRLQLIANQMFEQITSDMSETTEQIQLRQILVADEATARTIIEQLKSGVSFSDLAEAQSIDESSRTNGGDLGWFPRGMGLVPPEVEEIAFSLQPREVSGPIPTSLGFHIIQLQNRDTERPLKAEMFQVLRQQRFTEWLTGRRASIVSETFIRP